MSILSDRQNQFISDLNECESWNEKFNYIIELGEQMEEMHENERIPSNLITPCASKTYLSVKEQNGVVEVYGWSNAMIPQGLCAVCSSIFSGLSKQQIKDEPIFFHTDSGLMEQLTVLRQNALTEIIKKCVSLI